jgi:D-serine deaminase-like pyridoxal phosphate-dependent protein
VTGAQRRAGLANGDTVAGLQVAALTEAVTDTPRVVIDRAVVERNVQRMAECAAMAGVELRLHTRTHKMPQIARLQLAARTRGTR